MITNLQIKDAKFGSHQVKEIWKSSAKVWPSTNAFWTFSDTSGSTISNFKVVYSSGTLDVNWGDGNVESIASNVNVNHTYI
jgi:hypothetical protein